jgi:hypothetical protein
MRVAGIVTWCVGLALLVGGCDTTTDSQYFRYGIGTDLYSADIVETTQLQDIYLTELCRQALPLVSTADTECLNAMPGPNGWNLIVQAGLNDVDRRCDSYLAWLDDRRRTNNAVLKELGDVTVASQAIMRVAGVSANPITLAGLAFGLASNTFTNINSRLLLEVDKTTVQTLVLRRRDDFRIDLQNKTVGDRPSAIHALRLYLTICTPFAIETDINATVTVFQQVGSRGLDIKGPLVNPATIGKSFKSSTDTGTAPPRPPAGPVVPEFQAIFTNYDPKVNTPEEVGILARKLCLTNADIKNVPKMTAAIQVYQMTLRDMLNVPSTKVTGKLTPKQVLSLNDEAKCDNTKFANFFETPKGIPGGITNSGVLTLLNTARPKEAPLTANSSESQIRARIADVQQSLPKLTLRSAELSGQLTPDLVKLLTDPTQ